MNTIVVGGAGFIGSHVADALVEYGHTVRIYDIRPSPYLRARQEMIVGDILDEKQVRDAMEGVDIVYNFAGIADIEEASDKPLETIKYNILGNAILLDAAKLHRIKRFIYASTIYVYSDSGSFYRCSKIACENYIEAYHRQYGLDYTILRYGTIYGTRSDEKNSVRTFITQAMTEGKLTYYGNGNEVREYINVADAAKASVDILDDKYKNEHIIFAGYYPMKISELFTMIKEILKKDIMVEYLRPQSDDPAHHYTITPYTFIPKVGKRYLNNYYTDLGQGLLICMQEIYDALNSRSS